MSIRAVIFDQIEDFQNLVSYLTDNLDEEENEGLEEALEQFQESADKYLNDEKYDLLSTTLLELITKFIYAKKNKTKIQRNLTILGFHFVNQIADSKKQNEILPQIIDLVQQTWDDQSVEQLAILFNLLSKYNECKAELKLQILKLAKEKGQLNLVEDCLYNLKTFVEKLKYNNMQVLEYYEKVIQILDNSKVKFAITIELIGKLESQTLQKYKVDLSKHIIYLIKQGKLNQELIDLVDSQALQYLKQNNKVLYDLFYSYVQGDFDLYNTVKDNSQNTFSTAEKQNLQERLKIHSIPRVCQIGQVIKLQELAKKINADKSQIEDIVIKAIHENIVEAIIDQFEDEIKINNIKLKYFQNQDWQNLDKYISDALDKLQPHAV